MTQTDVSPRALPRLVAFDLDDTQCLLPAIFCCTTNSSKVQLRLLSSEVQQGILFADEGYARLDINRLTRLGVVGEPYPDIIPTDLLPVGRIDLVLALILVPFSFYAFHRRLLLPVARGWCTAADADSEVLIEDSLGSIAEGPHELAPYDGRVIEEAHGRTTLIRQPQTEVYEDIALTTALKGEGRDGCTLSSRHLSLDLVLIELYAVVARMCLLLAHGRAAGAQCAA